MKTQDCTEVEFAVRLLCTSTERVVCLLGNVSELGAWDVEKALPMELIECQGEESTWRTTVEFAVNTNTLEYKYVVKHKQTRELVSWEGLPGNRTLTIALGNNVALGAASYQSSTYTTPRAPIPGPREAKLGNNGNTNGFQEWRCCRTNKEANPWWEVDLGKEYTISSIHLWNAMTYHEQARHPKGRPPITSKASTSIPSPPLWVFISKESLDREADSLMNAQAKAATDATSFAELEVITQDPVMSLDRKEAPHTISSLKTDDGFYGVSNSLNGDINEYVEKSNKVALIRDDYIRKSIVGQLTLSYLVLTPFVHPKNNIAHVWRSYWRERPPLTIGHRGMGRSYYQVDGYRLALTRENTLASFILAGRSGADFVEFDVQLTKDQVPIIYHDFLVNAGLEDKHAGAFGTKSETYEIGIHDMTYRQLTQSYTTPVPHKGNKTQVLQNRVKKHWARLQGDKKVISPRRGHITRDAEKDNKEEEHHLVDLFPRLEDLLKHVPAEVGLNVEIKYPDPFFRATMRSSSQFAINAYLDKVLQCVFDHAGSRRIFFSCFDPSVCIALRAKQAKYPVLFLTYGSMAPQAMDSRMTLQFATNFAKMEKLQGIVSNSNAFVETPELAPLVKKDMQRVLMTWGDQNTNHEMVQLQKRHAVDGVISDNVIDLISQDKKLQTQAK
ncbi:hypothetical protein BBO99_00000574 [Phytophthora kernoviae]|uniref:CBM20 domain-containing protein n=2 Tax=Phytophthora kernoviae TaxID=325452 RepID=A0A3R7J9U3_9STRA|nr:hypothetical protein G195_001440 [Phytophthora kernoviae 00238/432]KAG2533136.1 hypothetical protein JM18_000570 [Phytophthora kernoviae]RLN26112.1 hypothetical protein BBI17_000613 [Phytophthora kernoviae]RLN85463.1 hypothetical protein BBO99_00000574 [Phytophthora kernoviae]